MMSIIIFASDLSENWQVQQSLGQLATQSQHHPWSIANINHVSHNYMNDSKHNTIQSTKFTEFRPKAVEAHVAIIIIFLTWQGPGFVSSAVLAIFIHHTYLVPDKPCPQDTLNNY